MAKSALKHGMGAAYPSKEDGEEVSPGMDWVMSENMSSELEGWSAEQVGFLTES